MYTSRPAPKPDPRIEHRTHQTQRVEDSQTLAEKFPNLDSLSASLAHFRPQGLVQIGSIKLTFNVAHARSVFRFDCSNHTCVGGDFDLTAALAKAVAARRKGLTGEVVCQGWRDKDTVDAVRCQHILRFKLSLGYKPGA